MQPEFDNTEKIKQILDKFDDKKIINSIKEDDNGINIYIGSENDIDEDLTVVKTKYNNNGEEGTIALIGPKRMEYDDKDHFSMEISGKVYTERKEAGAAIIEACKALKAAGTEGRIGSYGAF